MGVWLEVDLPGWEDTPNGGMKTINRDDEKFPKLIKPWDEYGPSTFEYRPANFELWRKNIILLFEDAETNKNAWLEALAFLEENPTEYIREL